MKKAVAITINNFTLIPVCRFVIELLSTRFSLSVAECKIKGGYTFEQYGDIRYLASFRSKSAFFKQSLYKKLYKYAHLYGHIFYLLFIKRVHVLYTPDIHVLSVVFFLRRFVSRRISIIYHQFELLDPALIQSKNLKLWNKLARHVNKVNLCIFPEINRLIFFCDKTGFDRTKCMVFANSCRLQNESRIRPEKLKNIPSGDLIIAHVGNVGANHYLSSFLSFVNQMNGQNNVHFLMIGGFSADVLNMLNRVQNRNFYVIGELSHSELSNYYSFIDIGFILYRGLDLNLEFCAPNKLYEYWSHGIYVIAHRLKGLAEVIKDDEMGMLVNLENTNEIKAAVQGFISIAGGEIRQYIRMGFDSKYSIADSIGRLNGRLDEFA